MRNIRMITSWWSAKRYVRLAHTDRCGQRAGAAPTPTPFDTRVSRFEAYAFLAGVRDDGGEA